MLQALQPKNIIPAHQDMSGISSYVNLCESEGYTVGRDLHTTRNGNVMQLVE